jgi:TatD DNase family protein
MKFIDTHCHIQEKDYKLGANEVIENANKFGVSKMICVGTDENTSLEAVEFVKNKDNIWASVGLHPHDASLGDEAIDKIDNLSKMDKVVAIGECGLDYFYNHSSKEDQMKALRQQIEIALNRNLPMIFHIRDAFEDFWPIFDSYKGLKGVVHSFTATEKELDQALSRGLLIGLNGIMTFTKDQAQLEAAKKVPLESLVLETDAPFLTPVPLRGKINEPKNVVLTAEFLSELRKEDLGELAAKTTRNAEKLFGI